MQFKTPRLYTDLERQFHHDHDGDTDREMPAMPKSSMCNRDWHDGLPKPSYPSFYDPSPRSDIEQICKLWFGRMVRVAATLYVLVVVGVLLYKVLMMVWAMK